MVDEATKPDRGKVVDPTTRKHLLQMSGIATQEWKNSIFEVIHYVSELEVIKANTCFSHTGEHNV